MPTNAVLAKEIECLRAEVAAMRDSLSMFNELVENVKKQNSDLATENKALKDENKQLTRRVSELEQYSRLNNVEIKGVPATKGESCLAVIQSMGDAVGCKIAPEDVDTVHRVPAKKDTNIIARFCSREKKTEFLKKVRKARLTTAALGFSPNNQKPLYANDHLTQERKRLFAQALEMKKAKGWKHLWTDHCVIKARRTDDSRVYRISSAGDLAVFA